MKKIYTSLLALSSLFTWAQQQTISFEPSEGYQLGTLHQQNGWTVTEGSSGFIQNQVITNEKASQGSYSFKNAFEPSFSDQFFPIFGAVQIFETPKDFSNFTISYDVLVDAQQGSDFEFTLYTTDENDIFVPVAGVGIENRGLIYLIKGENYEFDYAPLQWTPNVWTNVKIEVGSNEIKYYINNTLQSTIANYTQLNIQGFNMLHNNFGNNAYYDNFVITSNNLSVNPFENSTVSVYPNPASDRISIQSPANDNITNVAIFNLSGQQVMATSQSQNIDINSLSTGTYLVKATNAEGKTITRKISKK